MCEQDKGRGKGTKVLVVQIGQTLRIGENIKIMPTKIKGGRVRIGIDAPRQVKITWGNTGKD